MSDNLELRPSPTPCPDEPLGLCQISTSKVDSYHAKTQTQRTGCGTSTTEWSVKMKKKYLCHSWFLRVFVFYLRQRGCVFVVCLLATLRKNFRTEFLMKFSQKVRNEPTKKRLNFGSDLDHGFGYGSGSNTDPDRDTGKTCLGGGSHCSSASR